MSGGTGATWFEAALAALDGRGPLTAEEIVSEIVRRRLRVVTGKTPASTVSAALYVAIDQGDSRVAKAGPGRFRLTSGQLALGSVDSSGQLASAESEMTPSSRGTMSYLDAAERVLELDAGREPMALSRIVDKAIEHGFISPRGKTPAATLSAQIGTENRKRRSRGELPRFTKPERGYYGLTIWHGEGIVHAVGQHRDEVAGKLKEQLKEATPERFEAFVARLLAEIGVEDTEVVGQSGDKGIDVRGMLVVADVLRRPIAVQVKRWTAKGVGRPEVQQLRGSLRPHDLALLVAVGTFTKAARDEAARGDTTPVALLDGDGIVKLMLSNEIGVVRHELEYFELAGIDKDTDST